VSTQPYGEFVRDRSCTRKRPYHCQLDANQAVLEAAQQGQLRRTYRCDHCGLIHLTSKGAETA